MKYTKFATLVALSLVMILIVSSVAMGGSTSDSSPDVQNDRFYSVEDAMECIEAYIAEMQEELDVYYWVDLKYDYLDIHVPQLNIFLGAAICKGQLQGKEVERLMRNIYEWKHRRDTVEVETRLIQNLVETETSDQPIALEEAGRYIKDRLKEHVILFYMKEDRDEEHESYSFKFYMFHHGPDDEGVSSLAVHKGENELLYTTKHELEVFVECYEELYCPKRREKVNYHHEDVISLRKAERKFLPKYVEEVTRPLPTPTYMTTSSPMSDMCPMTTPLPTLLPTPTYMTTSSPMNNMCPVTTPLPMPLWMSRHEIPEDM